MASNPKDTFKARASLFSSPVGHCPVPRKKVARDAPPIFTFHDETPKKVDDAQARLMSTSSQPIQTSLREEDDDVELMEVDTSMVPSPQKTVQQQVEQQEQPQQKDMAPPCTTMTTPRRKSMPTPGKRLCFTSKDGLNEEKADESTQLELLMSQNSNGVPETVKALFTDSKTMTAYEAVVQKEIGELEAIKKKREDLLKKAKELENEPYISSILPTQTGLMEKSFSKEKEDSYQRLLNNFLKSTEDAKTAATKKVSLKKLEEDEKVEKTLKSHILVLENHERKMEAQNAEMLKEYMKEQEALEKINHRAQNFAGLISRLENFSLAF